jgi:4,5-DOPA dioxygenase extradiol
MYETQHPVYPKIQQVGKEITEKVKPKAIVVFSAHWQAGRDFVQVNTAEKTDLIYE